MNSLTIKIAAFFISLFVIITIGNQIYTAIYDPYEYETAVAYSYEDTLDFEGVYLRNESLVNYEGEGVLAYTKPDGTKVSVDSTIAEIYQSQSDITRQAKMETLVNEIEILQASQEAGATDVGQLDSVNRQIDEKYAQLISYLDNEDFSELQNTRDELQILLNRLQVITGKESDFTALITELEEEASTLQAQITALPTSIQAERSGYFVSYYDGYEDALHPDESDTLTVDKITSVLDNASRKTSTNVIGKIVEDYTWKIAGVIELKKDMAFLDGTTAKMKVGSIDSYIPAEIESVIPYPDEGKAVIVLSCDRMTYDLVLHRTDAVELLLGSYSGIRVPSSAVRYNEEGEYGVYVRIGQSIFFRKIEVIYDSEDFKIVDDLEQSGYLSMYDEIVVEGDDLYDGKPV